MHDVRTMQLQPAAVCPIAVLHAVLTALTAACLHGRLCFIFRRGCRPCCRQSVRCLSSRRMLSRSAPSTAAAKLRPSCLRHARARLRGSAFQACLVATVGTVATNKVLPQQSIPGPKYALCRSVAVHLRALASFRYQGLRELFLHARVICCLRNNISFGQVPPLRLMRCPLSCSACSATRRAGSARPTASR